MVFVTPTALQLSIFFKILHPDRLDDLVKTSTAESLALINTLIKISNSPILLKATLDKNKSVDSNLSVQRAAIYEAVKMIPEKVKIDDMSLSGWSSRIYIFDFPHVVTILGKLISLERMLEAIRRVQHVPLCQKYVTEVHMLGHGREMCSRVSLHVYA